MSHLPLAKEAKWVTKCAPGKKLSEGEDPFILKTELYKTLTEPHFRNTLKGSITLSLYFKGTYPTMYTFSYHNFSYRKLHLLWPWWFFFLQLSRLTLLHRFSQCKPISDLVMSFLTPGRKEWLFCKLVDEVPYTGVAVGHTCPFQ